MKPSPTALWLPAILAAAGLALAFWWPRPPASPAPPPAAAVEPAEEPAAPALSSLATEPDWTALEPFQETITRAEFESLLTTVFTSGGAWRRFMRIEDQGARLVTDDGEFHLRFAGPDGEKEAPRSWRSAAEMPPAPAGRPLDGVRIALDAGHIGGEFAKMEERWLVVDGSAPVCEGDMTLFVAGLLKPQLEALGATVSLVRETAAPVTPLRPADLVPLAARSLPAGTPPAEITKTAERLFYRTAEIRARAERVNSTLRPDLVVCLHFNAEPWGDPLLPTLVDRTHLHLILNGSYTDEEVALADQRFALLEKLLQRTHREEVRVGAAVAEAFAAASGLPPYQYPTDSPNVRAVPGQPYLWARNLLANRLYDCPVVFMEPYVMNSSIDFPRLAAGDYDGLREINGKLQRSIFREYAEAVAAGLATYHRKLRPPPEE